MLAGPSSAAQRRLRRRPGRAVGHGRERRGARGDGPLRRGALRRGRERRGAHGDGPLRRGALGPAGFGAAPSGTARSGAARGGAGAASSKLIAYLRAHQGSAKYLVAANGSQTTAPIIIATGKAVVTIGGFSGGDTAPTVAQLAAMVARGELKYVLVGGSGGAPGGTSNALTQWVTKHGTAVTGLGLGSGTLYRVSA